MHAGPCFFQDLSIPYFNLGGKKKNQQPRNKFRNPVVSAGVALARNWMLLKSLKPQMSQKWNTALIIADMVVGEWEFLICAVARPSSISVSEMNCQFHCLWHILNKITLLDGVYIFYIKLLYINPERKCVRIH